MNKKKCVSQQLRKRQKDRLASARRGYTPKCKSTRQLLRNGSAALAQVHLLPRKSAAMNNANVVAGAEGALAAN